MNCDVIGKLVKESTVKIEGEEVYGIDVYYDGWHVNTTSEVPEWGEFRIPKPSTPDRSYLGDIPTFYYVFPSVEVFDSLMPVDEGI